MNTEGSRFAALLLFLVAVWIVTYWAYEPGEPRVTFAEPTPVARESVDGDAPARAPVEARPPATPTRAPAPDPAPLLPAPGAREGSVPSTTAPPVDEKPGPSAANPVVVPPSFDHYVVRRGERGWEDVAQRVYGDRRHWQAIARANPFVDPTKLVPGRTVLRVPRDPSNIEGIVVTDAPASGGEGWTTHVVGPAETLSGIASKVYGRSALWQRIYDANRDQLARPDRLTVGMTLRIPPLEGDGSAARGTGGGG